MNESRRPLASRSVPLFQKLARFLASMGVSANQVSVLSMVFAMVAAFFWISFERSAARGDVSLVWVSAIFVIAGIQLRLLCNLIDGLIAIEGQKKSVLGDLYNEIPDRVADVLIIVAAGYATPVNIGAELGWAAACFAVLTAYVRALGASLGHGHDFIGPQAKPHRMFVLSVTALAAAVEFTWFDSISWSMLSGLLVVAIGSLLTSLRRSWSLAKRIKDAHAAKSPQESSRLR